MVNVILKSVKFAIKKNYSDCSVEDYLVFEMNLLKVECDITENGSLVVKVLVKNISLYDFDKDEKKRETISPYYQCLIESAQEDESGRLIKKQEGNEDTNISFIDYQLLIIGDELNNIVNINDLHIIASLESLLHMYQFSMYYVGIYLDTMKDAEIIKNMEIEKNSKIEYGTEKELFEKQLRKVRDENIEKSQKYFMYNIDNLNDIKLKIKKEKDKKIFSNIKNFEEYVNVKYMDSNNNKKETISSERKRSILTVLVNMKNTRVKIPLTLKN